MMEALRIIPFTLGSLGLQLGALSAYWTTPYGFTLIGLSAAPNTDDASLTLDINDGATEIVGALATAVKATPSTWLTTGLGGTQAAVHVAANSVVSFDANSATSGTQVYAQLYVLLDEVHV